MKGDKDMPFVNPDPSVISDKDLYIFDMDGTIYLGFSVFPFAVRFINHLRASGRKVLFFTNNASHTADFYVRKLTRLGFSPTRDEIMTSGDVTIEFLRRHRPGKSVYLVGTDELVEDFRAAGINMLTGEEEKADIVITSFDTTLTYHKLDMACRLIRGGAEYLSTHPDFNCPTETGFIPDIGAMMALIKASTGRDPDLILGKPYRGIVDEALLRTGFSLGEMAMVGDRLYTDVATGVRHGMTGILVLSGEAGMADVEASDVQPDLIFGRLSDMIPYL